MRVNPKVPVGTVGCGRKSYLCERTTNCQKLNACPYQCGLVQQILISWVEQKRMSHVCSRSCSPSRFRGNSRSPAHSGRTSVPRRQAYRSIGPWLDRMCPCRSHRCYTDRYLRRYKCLNSAIMEVFPLKKRWIMWTKMGFLSFSLLYSYF